MKLVDWADKSVVAQNQVEMGLVSQNSTYDVLCVADLVSGNQKIVSNSPIGFQDFVFEGFYFQEM